MKYLFSILFTALFIMVLGIIIILSVKQETKTIVNKIDTTMSNAITSTIKQPALLTDYEIELITQDSVLIYNGSEVSQVHFNDIQKYIISDNE